jgi:hypothetical protein
MTSAQRSDRDRDNFYLPVGELIRGWVKLELLLLMWLPDLLGIDEFRSHVLWNSYGDLRSKLNLLKTLVKNFADESLWEEASKILAGVEKIAENRHILAHTFGDVDEKANRLLFISDNADKDFVVNFLGEKTVDTDNLKDWIRNIGESHRSIEEFGKKLGSGVHEESLMHRRSSRAGSRG